MYFDKVYFDEQNNPREVNLICDKCGESVQLFDMTIFTKVQSEYCIVSESKTVKCVCGNICQCGIIETKKLVSLEKSKINKSVQTKNTPKCPTCGSTNIEKISLTKKAFGGAMFGLFSSDVRNTMKCKNCGAKW